ncbi:MAG: hypothetical protein AUH76_02000 [Candidatus Rokubacteria bacterium 13_1_40CM_4_67_11]|nr:MAG: hypothetical protein AUH76_02000 [Candidatus Rokubacteria bacterium 13_1_40CM_4_67_11]
MKTLERHRIDEIVRELETGAYGLALAPGLEPAAAERVLLDAFASMAPSVPRTTRIDELRKELYARIRKRAPQEWAPAKTDPAEAPAATVSKNLHLRLVDILEEHQADEPAGRRRAVLLAFIGAAIVAGGIAIVRVHADALSAAQPTINELSPPAAATDVGISGDVRVKFGRRPAGTPTLRLEPAHAALESVHWDGNTLVAVYAGLHLSTRYQLVLQADYRSRLEDVGHFEKRWTVTTQGYPALALTPAQDQTVVARVGKFSVDFSYLPPAKLRLTISPADGVLTLGQWSGTTWTAGYSGLKPLTQYEVTLTVDYGAAAASTRRQWTFTTEPGAPPAGVPVIWYGTRVPFAPQTEAQSLLAIDWQGKLAGTMDSTSAVVRQAPDGSVLFTQDGNVLDRNGVPGAAWGFPYIGMTADDSCSTCIVGDPGGGIGGGQLWVLSGPVRGPLRRVAPANWGGAGPAPGVIACSVASDRVVVADTGDRGLTTGVRVIALSTGRVLYQRSYAGPGERIVSSRDARYLAELTPSYDAQGQLLATPTLIRRIADGRVVARIDKQWVVGFSWDGMRVVTGPFLTDVGPMDSRLVEWQTGKVLWEQPGGPPVNAMAQPNGPAMAIALGGHSAGGVDQLWLVAGDGHATQVVNEAFYPAFNAGF